MTSGAAGVGEHGGGYASLSGTRIERDPEVAPEDAASWGEGEPEEGEALELTFEAEEAGGYGEEEPAATQDELLLDASRLAEEDGLVQPGTPGRRRRMLGGSEDELGEPEAGATPPPQRRAPAAPPTGGSTLFERMANLSRASSSSSDEDEEEDSGGSSLRIPRFLGRQNNQ